MNGDTFTTFGLILAAAIVLGGVTHTLGVLGIKAIQRYINWRDHRRDLRG